MLLGMICSFQINISKCFQFQGIETLKYFKFKISGKIKKNDIRFKRNKIKPAIYILGLILSNSAFVWLIFANSLAPVHYFTAMSGTGIFFLIIYSHIVLNESINKRIYLGVLVFIAGTVLTGINGVMHVEVAENEINLGTVIIIGTIIIMITILALRFRLYFLQKSINLFAALFGFIAGTLGCFDPVFKWIGQNIDGSPGLIPISNKGWIIFIVSFLFTTTSFIVTQWSFSIKDIQISRFIPYFYLGYITMPVFINEISITYYQNNTLYLIGILLIITGIFIIQDFKSINNLF
jgi:drug/metabolite transporter (DMT)-like permease